MELMPRILTLSALLTLVAEPTFAQTAAWTQTLGRIFGSPLEAVGTDYVGSGDGADRTPCLDVSSGGSPPLPERPAFDDHRIDSGSTEGYWMHWNRPGLSRHE